MRNIEVVNEFSQIKTFVALVEHQSVSKTADKLNVAISAVSRRLKELESELGVQLNQRTTRKMNVTAAGQKFYERCCHILDDLAEAKQEANSGAIALKGTLKIATPLSFGVAHLAPAIATFMHLHADIKVDLNMSDRRVDIIEEGLDLAIRIGSLHDSTLKARKLASVSHVVCASPEFIKQWGSPKSPADLSKMPSLCYGNINQSDVWQFHDSANKSGSVKVPVRMRATNGEALVEAAVSGLGVICEPSFIVYSAIERGLLIPLLIDHKWYDMNIYAVYPTTKHLPSRVRVFIDFLVEHFGEAPYWENF